MGVCLCVCVCVCLCVCVCVFVGLFVFVFEFVFEFEFEYFFFLVCVCVCVCVCVSIVLARTCVLVCRSSLPVVCSPSLLHVQACKRGGGGGSGIRDLLQYAHAHLKCMFATSCQCEACQRPARQPVVENALKLQRVSKVQRSRWGTARPRLGTKPKHTYGFVT